MYCKVPHFHVSALRSGRSLILCEKYNLKCTIIIRVSDLIVGQKREWLVWNFLAWFLFKNFKQAIPFSAPTIKFQTLMIIVQFEFYFPHKMRLRPDRRGRNTKIRTEIYLYYKSSQKKIPTSYSLFCPYDQVQNVNDYSKI